MSILDDLQAAANPFGTPSANKWSLQPGVWVDSTSGAKTQFFAEVRAGDKVGQLTAVDQIADSGRRRLAKYEYPYLDGQRLQDLGRTGETYTFNVKFFGPNYQTKFKEFYNNVYRSNSIGKLTHPILSAIRGAIDCRLESFEPVHRADESNAVTIKVTFVEDNANVITYNENYNDKATPLSALQSSLKNLVQTQANISTLITSATGVLQLPSAIAASLNARKASLIGQISGLFGQLGATFASSSDLLSVLSVASATVGGNVTDVSSGTVTTRSIIGVSQTAQASPVFQVSLDQNTQTLVDAQIDAFINANQISASQAVFSANQSRAEITAAIAEAESTLGNYAYDIVAQYRALAVTIQTTVEACIAAQQSQITMYTLPRAMSLRMVAFENGLTADDQNALEQLNLNLPSVNLIAQGSVVAVPA